MRNSFYSLLFVIICVGCDSTRLFEENKDLANNQWIQRDTISFSFTIRDLGKKYNVYSNIRNTSNYPYARFFFNYTIKDSTGAILNNDLKSVYLFDAKTGKPFGNTGIGDVFDHRIGLLENYVFKYNGRYTISLDQQMRLDTLAGISAVGFRLEEAVESKR
jgi:gliding motility-associated lipoprotein GldH